MTTYNRPDANVPVWAESGDKVQPTNPEVQTGWPNSNVPPSRQRFNWILNLVSNGLRYLLQRGIPEWSAAEDYPIGARVQYSGLTYVSLTANTNKRPDTNTSDWELWAFADSALQPRVDQAVSISVTTADVTLSASQAKAGILLVTGTLTGNRNIIIPNTARRIVIINSTSGAYSLGVKTSSGSAVTVAQGAATSVVCDGANNVKLASTDLSSYAPINSPALTGVPTAPTATTGTNTTQIATTAFVQAQLSSSVPAASETVAGKVELATAAETTAGTDNTRAVTPAGLAAAGATKLRTPRTLTIGNTGKSFDGSADVSWSLAEIGAAGFGILADGTDLNTVVAPGFYRLNSTHGNAPPGVGFGQLIVSRGGVDTILQIATGFSGGEIYWRQGNPPDVGGAGSWSAWHRFFHSGNLGAASETTAGLVELATAAEAQVLASAVVALTPARLADAFKGANQSLSGNGYQKLPGGLIIQWGISGSVAAGAAVNVTLPIAFPNAVLSVTGTPVGASVNSNSGGVGIAASVSALTIYNWGSAIAYSAGVRWIAIGY